MGDVRSLLVIVVITPIITSATPVTQASQRAPAKRRASRSLSPCSIVKNRQAVTTFMITPAEMMAIRCQTFFAEYERGFSAMFSSVAQAVTCWPVGMAATVLLADADLTSCWADPATIRSRAALTRT